MIDRHRAVGGGGGVSPVLVRSDLGLVEVEPGLSDKIFRRPLQDLGPIRSDLERLLLVARSFLTRPCRTSLSLYQTVS